MSPAEHCHAFPPDERQRVLRWVPLAARRATMEAPWWQWLASTDSLTARLIAASPRPFHVRLVSQGVKVPRRDEAQALGLAAGRVAWVREVALMSGERCWVVARSVAPLTRRGHRQLRALGERSLGSWLFAQPDLERGPIEIAPVAPDGETLWLRRSRFRHGGIRLLVQEGFQRDMAEDLGLAHSPPASG
ncbi:chorismate--pyruvate lyase family protein [Salinicola aestuarinus]|uniref:chorismate--pyruvate lyase family protein n=1 Tax=Salinicola aestuarinus TaxID=1949082 RepID=UPI001FD8B985|nr:chorismate lyase [Salinicola aestuarinus]